MNTIDDDFYTEIDLDEDARIFLETMIPLRAGIYLDPDLAEPWSCDPARCRPLLGRNLCCKVEERCDHFTDDVCEIHEGKPFSCALFPIDLMRIGNARVVFSARNPIAHLMSWSRYDRDMLRCFEGEMVDAEVMLMAQLPVLEKVFTQAEIALMVEAMEELLADK